MGNRIPVGIGARGKWVRESPVGEILVWMKDGVRLCDEKIVVDMSGENYGHGLRCPCAECGARGKA